MHPAILKIRFAFTPELYAGVHGTIDLIFKLQYKISVIYISCQKRVWFAKHGCANHFTILYCVFCFTIELLPARKVFAIEEGFPAGPLCLARVADGYQ